MKAKIMMILERRGKWYYLPQTIDASPGQKLPNGDVIIAVGNTRRQAEITCRMHNRSNRRKHAQAS